MNAGAPERTGPRDRGSRADTDPDTPVVWIDGELLDPRHASLHWSDHGITVGDGVFETIKVDRGGAFALDAHLDRLERSAVGLGLVPAERDLVVSAIESVVGRWNSQQGDPSHARLRVTVTAGPGPTGSERGTRGPTVMVTAGPLALSREPTGVVVVPFTRNERGALAGLKTTSYAENVVALARARERGASEAIFANTRGELCEGTGSNVFVGHDGVLTTPPLESGCLAGITRELLVDALSARGVAVAISTLPVGALAAASEAFLTSTTREVQPVSAVDSVALAGAPGPLTRAAMDAWDAAYA